MGKRKKVIPKKVTELQRRTLTWNMSDMQPSGSTVNVVFDNDPEILEELDGAKDIPVKVRKTDSIKQNSHGEVLTEQNIRPSVSFSGLDGECQAFRKDDLLDIFDLHVQNCATYFQIYDSLKSKKDIWSCEFAKFEISFSMSPIFIPLPVDGLSDIEHLIFYVNGDGEKHVLAYDKQKVNQSASSKSKRRSSLGKNDKDMNFWLVTATIPQECLEALKCRKLQVVVDKFDSEEMCLSVKIMGTEEVLTELFDPSVAVRPKGLNTSLKILMGHFYSTSEPGNVHLYSAHLES